MPRFKDITGQSFGRLIAIKPIGNSKHHGGTLWLCKCICGNIKNICVSNLTCGTTKSCGCLQQETRIESNKKDIKGVRSGKLVAISPTKKTTSGGVWWKCRCDCGNYKEVTTYNIKSGHVISCGCARKRRGKYRKAELREKKLYYENTRRARKLKAFGVFTEKEVKILYDRQSKKCAICFVMLPYDRIERDHVIPLARGGANDISNIQILCRSCNARKNDKDPIIFAQENGRLL